MRRNARFIHLFVLCAALLTGCNSESQRSGVGVGRSNLDPSASGARPSDEAPCPHDLHAVLNAACCFDSGSDACSEDLACVWQAGDDAAHCVEPVGFHVFAPTLPALGEFYFVRVHHPAGFVAVDDHGDMRTTVDGVAAFAVRYAPDATAEAGIDTWNTFTAHTGAFSHVETMTVRDQGDRVLQTRQMVIADGAS